MRSIPAACLLVLLTAGASAAPAPPVPPDQVAITLEAIDALRDQQRAMIEQAEQMLRRIERLARAVREQSADPVRIDELTPVLLDLDSDDYRTRMAASTELRRALVDRMWQLVERPDLGPEALHRLRSILIESSAMIRLTELAIALESADRDALWNLLDEEPTWVLDALGDDPERIQQSLRRVPPGHDLAAEVVIATLVRDEMRPLPQLIALQETSEAASPLLRQALLSLLVPRERLRISGPYGVVNSREQVAELAVRILARRPAPDLAGWLVATLETAKTWSTRLELTIVEALVAMRARDAAPLLLRIAGEKKDRLRGSHGLHGMMIKPGDCELIGAALLLDMDLGELRILQHPGTSAREPTYYGFPAPKPTEDPERAAAYERIAAIVGEAGPVVTIPGYADALERMAEEPR